MRRKINRYAPFGIGITYSIVAIATLKGVVPAKSCQNIVAITARQDIIVVRTGQGIITSPCDNVFNITYPVRAIFSRYNTAIKVRSDIIGLIGIIGGINTGATIQ